MTGVYSTLHQLVLEADNLSFGDTLCIHRGKDVLKWWKCLLEESKDDIRWVRRGKDALLYVHKYHGMCILESHNLLAKASSDLRTYADAVDRLAFGIELDKDIALEIWSNTLWYQIAVPRVLMSEEQYFAVMNQIVVYPMVFRGRCFVGLREIS